MPVLIDSAGQLGTLSSSARYKEDISDMGSVSEKLLALRPVTFRYRKEFDNGEKPRQFGLIAEEVAEVFPELVVYDEQGMPETVKYHLLATLLLNELQRQASLNEEQARLIDEATRVNTEQVLQLRKHGAELLAVSSLRSEVIELRELTARLASRQPTKQQQPKVAGVLGRPRDSP